MSALISDMVAVHDNFQERVWIYFVDSEGHIKWYKGLDDNVPENQVSNKPYEGPFGPLTLVDPEGGDNLIVTVHEKSRTVAVVDYKPSNGVPETRVYYVNEKGRLQEACWTKGVNDSQFYKGALSNLNNSGPKVEPGSVLTATVFEQYLKVYYQEKDENDLCVAWVTRGETAWSSRRAVPF